MSAITTHVLDTSRGRAAAGIDVRLDLQDAGSWRTIGRGTTDADGRQRSLMPEGSPLEPGTYRLVFETARYFDDLRVSSLYPRVTVEFIVSAGESHYHVPLLLSPFGYSTYRGT
jgi:5-hydroxyisourate hydrolase